MSASFTFRSPSVFRMDACLSYVLRVLSTTPGSQVRARITPELSAVYDLNISARRALDALLTSAWTSWTMAR